MNNYEERKNRLLELATREHETPPPEASQREKPGDNIMKPDTVALSKHTMAILRNFSKISDHFAFQPGNALKIRSQGIFAKATATETFPCEFPVELSTFLSLTALFKQPHLLFVEGNHIRVTEPDGS